MTTNNIIYLENYVESTGALPAELQRLLNTIRDLDERSLGLAEKIRRDVDICLEKPSQASRKVGTEHASEVADARRAIEEDQRMLVQWAEEKVALAGVTAELIDLHARQLDKDLEALETELQANGGVPEGVLDVFPPMEEVRRRTLQREDSRRDSDMEMQLKAALAQPAPQPKMKARESDALEMRATEVPTRRLSSLNSGMGLSLSGLPMALSGLDQFGSDAAVVPLLSQQASLTQHAAAAGEFAVPPPRAAQAALMGPVAPSQHTGLSQQHGVPHTHVPMAAQQHVPAAHGHGVPQQAGGPVLSHPQLQLQQQLMVQQQKQREQQRELQRPGKGKREKVEGPSLLGIPSTGHAQKRKAAMAAQQGIQLATAALTAPDLDMADAEPAGGLGGSLLPQIAPPEGMSHAAQAPQAPGRLLTHADIGHSLTGRRAELFWPDDNLWYLIEISSVNIVEHKAQIMYTTGETEELDLDEIVREGHMSLILV